VTNGLALGAEGLRRRLKTGFAVEVDRLEVPSGRTVAILGPSGSGKSTLLSMLGLLERPDTGRILLDGRPVTTADRRARLAMAAVFQRPYLLKGSVADNVAYGLKLRRVSLAERAVRVENALARVGLESFRDRSATTLSGGEAQRVALARALVLQPQVLLLDEPLASLDPLLKRRLVADFATILRKEAVTVVYVTHDHDEARIIADDITVMNGGRIVAHGPAQDVMTLPADEWTAEFLGMETPGRGIVRESSDGLSSIEAGAGTIVVGVGAYLPGTRVIFSVPPEDVMLAAAGVEIGPLSARNRLDGIVERIEPRGATWRVVVQIDGASLAATVSHAAVSELGLTPASRVQVIFKATAVRVAPAPETDA